MKKYRKKYIEKRKKEKKNNFLIPNEISISVFTYFLLQ